MPFQVWRRQPKEHLTALALSKTLASNHSWLTGDYSWLVAGSLRVGELMRQFNGSMPKVKALLTLPGVRAMSELSPNSPSPLRRAKCGDGAVNSSAQTSCRS